MANQKARPGKSQATPQADMPVVRQLFDAALSQIDEARDVCIVP